MSIPPSAMKNDVGDTNHALLVPLRACHTSVLPSTLLLGSAAVDSTGHNGCHRGRKLFRHMAASKKLKSSLFCVVQFKHHLKHAVRGHLCQHDFFLQLHQLTVKVLPVIRINLDEIVLTYKTPVPVQTVDLVLGPVRLDKSPSKKAVSSAQSVS